MVSYVGLMCQHVPLPLSRNERSHHQEGPAIAAFVVVCCKKNRIGLEFVGLGTSDPHPLPWIYIGSA
jgi:hypothetical protein